MSNANRVLPNLEGLNPTELKALILSQHELIVSRDSEIEQLKLLIAKLRRMAVWAFVGEAGSAD
jgi:hypothetical protein